ncbi:hypothetical protein [Paenibacillus gallinarum]|nr:hypothetical protein [Paenibacillus gallinarum]
MVFIIVVIVIGFAGVIGNQNSALRRMESIQRSLDEINQKIRDEN